LHRLLRTAANKLRRIAPKAASVPKSYTPTQVLLESALRLHQAGRLDDALPLYRRSLELDPASDIAHNLLGTLLCGQGRLEDGEACFSKALEANPSNVEALNNLGNVRKEKGDILGAEALYQKALELRPHFAAASHNLGLLYLECRRLEDAMHFFQRSLSSEPDYAEAHNNLGTALRMRGRLAEAEKHFRAAISADPNLAEAYCGLGDVLQVRGMLDEAELSCKKSLELRPKFADAMHNLATIAITRKKFETAQSYCEAALQIAPDHIGALNHLGTLARWRADHLGAEVVFRRALAIDPDHAVTRFNLANILLLRENYTEGFELYESRLEAFQRPCTRSAALNAKLQSRTRWRGEPTGNKRLLVWAEQGLGDSLMMLRYLPLLSARGVGSFAVYCDDALRRVVQSLGAAQRVIVSDEEAEAVDFDVHCPIMSLPYVFGTGIDSVPDTSPYLRVPADLVSTWRARLNLDKRSVGLAWAGSRTLQEDARRSISLDRFTPFLSVKGIEFISLQQGDTAVQWREFRDLGSHHIEQCADLLDTAALIANLNLVISVDTAVAHLAGALGKPVWLLNRHGSEWRWGPEAERTRWYPSMKIFREPHSNGWDAVIARITAELNSSQLDGDA